MPVEHATLEDAVANGIDLGSNAFMLIHGWTAGPLLLEFVAKVATPLAERALTAAELAAETGAQAGPLAIMLRTCSILGYVSFSPTTSAYSLVAGPELDELKGFLSPAAPTAIALQSIYSDASPPFKVPSLEATCCLSVWSKQRESWKNAKSRVLRILLDGIVLAPLLTSITYFARWDDQGLDFGKEHAMDNFDFGKADADLRAALGNIFEELGVGSMNPEGILALTSKGSLAMQRCYSFYVPTSYSPMLAQFGHILTEDAAWGFVGTGQDAEESEVHVNRTLNVVGSGAQHRTLFKDLMRHIDAVFAGEDFASQPSFVVDTGCGDGHLLMHIYEHVKKRTPRGRALEGHPLTMVGVDFNEESRMATSVNLSSSNVPHMVFKGDIGKPAEIMATLKKGMKRKKVDLSKALHVRSFLDHDRPYIAPARKLDEDGVAARYARSEMADFVHLDKHGSAIAAPEVFASLVEHFERWGDALEGSFGLCMLEVMMLDVPTTQRFINDCVSFHFDIVQCLSRQYMITPAAFAMGAAMAGLLPKDFNNVQTYPEQAQYCRVMNQHLSRRAFKIRFAEVSDLDSLVRLEDLAWAENLRATPEVLRKRLETSPTTNLAVELNGTVVAVLYMQLVPSVDTVDSERFMTISDAHSEGGRVLQLIALAADPDPEVSSLGIGSELRAFALHLARVDPKVDCVVGVTRCGDFKSYSGTMQEYVDGHAAGDVFDPIVGFHTSYGAKVVRLVPGFRPEDEDNGGAGVLIQYQVKEWVAKDTESAFVEAQPVAQEGEAEPAAPKAPAPAIDVLSRIMADLGYSVDADELDRGFFAYGIDSLEMVKIRNRLSRAVGKDLSSTLLLDFPNVKDLAAEVDRQRQVKAQVRASKAQAGSAAPTLEVLSGIMADLGYPVDRNELDRGFFHYAIDSLEMVRIRNRLGVALAMELSSTLLLDYPNVQDLSSHLDKVRGARAAAAKGQPPKEQEVERPKTAWDAITVDELLQVQAKRTKLYSLPKNQNRISDTFQKHGSNGAAYAKALEPLLDEVDGPIFIAFELIQDQKHETVQKCRADMAGCVTRFCQLDRRVLDNESDLERLMKQDQFRN